MSEGNLQGNISVLLGSNISVPEGKARAVTKQAKHFLSYRSECWLKLKSLNRSPGLHLLIAKFS